MPQFALPGRTVTVPTMAPPPNVNVLTRAPSPALHATIRRFLIVEFSEARDDSHLPEPGLIAAFRFRGECLVNDRAMPSPAILSGLTGHVRRHRHGRANAQLVVHFTPTGAAAFTRLALDELWNGSAGLGDVLGRPARVTDFLDQLASACDHAERFRLADRFFRARLGTAEPDPLVEAAVRWIEQAPPPARIAQLVRHIGLSQSALERRFRQRVGTSPKRFAFLLRLNQAAQLCQRDVSLTTVAHTAGYYDQAHFNHEFRRVTGLAPGAYFAQTTSG